MTAKPDLLLEFSRANLLTFINLKPACLTRILRACE